MWLEGGGGGIIVVVGALFFLRIFIFTPPAPDLEDKATMIVKFLADTVKGLGAAGHLVYAGIYYYVIFII